MLMGDKAKRRAIFTKLKKLGKGIFLLQETHSTKPTENIWKGQWGNQNIKFSHGSSKSKGVAILFSCELDIKIEREITDINGRYVILDIECGGYICIVDYLGVVIVIKGCMPCFPFSLQVVHKS